MREKVIDEIQKIIKGSKEVKNIKLVKPLMEMTDDQLLICLLMLNSQQTILDGQKETPTSLLNMVDVIKN
jgi:hypothetical protein